MKLLRYFLLSILAIALLAGCKHPAKSGTLVLNMQATYGGVPLKLDSFYTDPDNRYVKVETLMYFLSHIYLVKSDNSLAKAADIQFVNVNDPTTLSLTVTDIQGDYTGLTFYCGLDSTTDSTITNPSTLPSALQSGAAYMYMAMLKWMFENVAGVWYPDTSPSTLNPLVYHVFGSSYYKQGMVTGNFSVCCGQTTTKTLVLDFKKIYYQGSTQVLDITTQNYTQSTPNSASETATAAAFSSAFSQAFSLQ